MSGAVWFGLVTDHLCLQIVYFQAFLYLCTSVLLVMYTYLVQCYEVNDKNMWKVPFGINTLSHIVTPCFVLPNLVESLITLQEAQRRCHVDYVNTGWKSIQIRNYTKDINHWTWEYPGSRYKRSRRNCWCTTTPVLANSETSPFWIAYVWNDWLEFLTQIIKFAYMSLDLLNATSSRLSFWWWNAGELLKCTFERPDQCFCFLEHLHIIFHLRIYL